jgi:Carbon-nitrogen hydrolase
LSRALSIVAVQTAPVAWDPAATWIAFESDVRARRDSSPNAHLFVYPVPEVARHLAWMGAEVIIQPTLTDTSDRAQELVLGEANAIVNQVFIVNVNAGGALGVGRSLIVDPEGHVLSSADHGEAQLTEVIDLDAVPRAREYGTAGLNRMWTQLADDTEGPRLPLYGGDFSALRRGNEP